MSCSWTPAWGGRGIPSSARARLTRSCPPRAPSAEGSLRKQRASPATVTGKRRRSGSWNGRRKISCALGTRSTNWSCKWSLSVPRRRPPRPTCAVGTSCGFWSCPCGWSSWKGCGTPSESCCPTPSTLPSSVGQRRMLRNSSTPKRRRWGSRCASGSWLWKPCGKRRRR